MKKQIEKKFEHIVCMIETIEQYNRYLNDNRYFEGYGAGNKQLSFDVKMHSAYLPTDAVEDYLTVQNITGERKEQILEEFDGARMEGIWYHFIEDQQEGFRLDITEWNEHPLYDWVDVKDISFYGRGGGHLCLGKIENFELEIGDTEIGNYPIWDWSRDSGSYWSFNKPVEELINSFKENFGVTSQKEVYKQLVQDSRRGDLKDYYDSAIKNQEKLEKLEKQITEFKKNAKKYLIEFLHAEIDRFIEDEYSVEMAIEKAEAGDYSQIDSFKEITSESILTNRNARVPTRDAQIALTAITSGHGTVGIKIGNFTLNRISVYLKDTYVKVGCHLFSLNQAKTAFSSLR